MDLQMEKKLVVKEKDGGMIVYPSQFYYRRAERKMRPAHPRENRRIKEKELPAAAPFYAPMSSRTKNADARNITTSAQSAAGIV